MNYNLTKREYEIYRVFATEDVRVKDVAKKYCVSCHTIKAHLEHIYSKLGINSIPNLIRHYYTNINKLEHPLEGFLSPVP